MSVEDWARHEAERAFDGVHVFTAHGFQLGIVHAFSALLSDEAVSEAVDLLRGYGFDIWGGTFREALQAAVTAVTEGDTE